MAKETTLTIADYDGTKENPQRVYCLYYATEYLLDCIDVDPTWKTLIEDGMNYWDIESAFLIYRVENEINFLLRSSRKFDLASYGEKRKYIIDWLQGLPRGFNIKHWDEDCIRKVFVWKTNRNAEEDAILSCDSGEVGKLLSEEQMLMYRNDYWVVLAHCVQQLMAKSKIESELKEYRKRLEKTYLPTNFLTSNDWR